MEKILNAEARTETGKGCARRLRRAGRIPAVMYGRADVRPLSVEAREFRKTFSTISESSIIKLRFDDGEREVLIKDYDEDITNGEIKHIDFYEVKKGQKLRTHMSIEFTGNPAGVREGGVLDHSLYEVEIECLPKDLPEQLIHDITELKVGEAVRIADLTLPNGVVVLNDADQLLVSIVVPRGSDDTAAEGAEDESAE